MPAGNIESLKRHVPSGICLGDRITGRVEFGMDGGSRDMTGTVIYIHPQGRFFTLRFDFERGSFRQSYMLRGRIDSPVWGDEPITNVFQTPSAGYLSR